MRVDEVLPGTGDFAAYSPDMTCGPAVAASQETQAGRACELQETRTLLIWLTSDSQIPARYLPPSRCPLIVVNQMNEWFLKMFPFH